jgi:hypothetical protein
MAEGDFFDLFRQSVSMVFIVILILPFMWPLYRQRAILRHRKTAAARAVIQG